MVNMVHVNIITINYMKVRNWFFEIYQRKTTCVRQLTAKIIVIEDGNSFPALDSRPLLILVSNYSATKGPDA